MTLDYDKPDDLLDVGSSLKKEKTLKENQEKVAKLKEEYQKQQNTDAFFHWSVFSKYKTLFFLLFIIIVATGIRLYIASMPLTEQWAEQVVEENLKVQVSNKIAEQYPTLSDIAKGELINQGTQSALAAEQNQQAMSALEQKYKESYQDSKGNNYLYEIDPYYFYELAQRSDLTWDKAAHTFLPLFEKWWYSLLSVFTPNLSFVKAISYIPLFFTILCGFCIFFISKWVWNETAGMIAALLFVSHPLLLEFSLLGFVDTNMLNIFFILSTGLLFIYASEYVKQKKYVYAGIFSGMIIFLILLFQYNWSAWYISPLLIITSLCCYALLFFLKRIYLWNQQIKTIKYILVSVPILVLIIGSIFFIVSGNPSVQQYIPNNVKVYLQLDYENPYGLWPDAFSLIKELQNNSFSIIVSYMGKLFFIVSISAFLYGVYKIIKKENLLLIYLVVAYIVFAVLAFRAVRLLPYFIPFFSLFFGIGVSSTGEWISIKLKDLFFPKERKSILLIAYIIFFIVIALPFVYPLAVQIKEKSNIMPIMDDAIYNSAAYIRETSPENAIISTWWDRGTFYKALAEREVQLHSAPHMPRTYWLSLFYTTNSSVEAKNIQMMLTCQNEFNFPTALSNNLSKSDSLLLMKEFLSVNTFEEQEEIINASFIDNSIKLNILNALSGCYNNSQETYVVVIDDLMPRFSSVQYLAAWNFETQQPSLQHTYTDLEEGGCSRTHTGIYCTISNANFYVNFTTYDWKAELPVDEVFVVANNTVMHNAVETSTVKKTLIVYQRADQWKALYLPKEVADSLYIRLMLLDAYNAPEFEKVFDEVHTETSWVKVYKVKS